jgi:DNA invertase Pin-like site-specific DNA recombinase
MPMAKSIPAAQYLRMSTDHQQYSFHNQEAVIEEYAKIHDFQIVRTYSDAAKSGVVLKSRSGLQTLLKDVVGGNSDYKAVLVYDVSRWGRFQDSDEAACYEFLCRKSGVPVHYCAESFANDHTAATALLKSLKRTMAAEFSRELSNKVFEAKARVVQRGFWVGGRAPYGFRRMVISNDHKRNRALNFGERKNLQTDRVILVPGPSDEVKCVRRIYQMALRNRTCKAITHELNRQGFTHCGRPWIYHSVLNVLRNPVYTGSNTWARTSQKFHSPPVQLGRKRWISKPNAFLSIIDQSMFQRTQEVLQARNRKWSDIELLDKLRWLLAKNGRLSQNLVDNTKGFPCATTLCSHFGSLRRSFELAGYPMSQARLARAKNIEKALELRAKLINQLVAAAERPLTLVLKPRPQRPILSFENGSRISCLICPSLRRPTGGVMQWRAIPIKAEREYVTLVCLLNARNDGFHSFYVFPNMELRSFHQFGENDSWLRRGTRLEHLSQFCDVAKGAQLQQPQA